MFVKFFYGDLFSFQDKFLEDSMKVKMGRCMGSYLIVTKYNLRFFIKLKKKIEKGETSQTTDGALPLYM